jgi:uncharacterized integral membrane protein (TIGR00698 family)
MIKKSLYGLTNIAILSISIRSAHELLPLKLQRSMGEVIFGVLIGLLINQFFSQTTWFKKCLPGIKFSIGELLKFSIILLGVRISVQTLVSVGGSGFILILFTMVMSLSLTFGLGKLLKVPSKLTGLIGIGAAICGNTAISATGPAIKASDEEVSFAIATNTLFGTMAVFFYPMMAQILNMDPYQFGLWSGVAVNDTSQVIATSFSYSVLSGETATTVKLTRNALMGFVIVLASLFYNKNTQWNKQSLLQTIKLPRFITLFVIVVGLNSIGLFQYLETSLNLPLIENIKGMTKFFILMALTAVGLNTNLGNLKKLGIKPLILGLSASSVVSLASFLAIKYFFKG